MCVRYIESQVFHVRVCGCGLMGLCLPKGWVCFIRVCIRLVRGTRNVGCTHTDLGAQTDNLRTMLGVLLTRIWYTCTGNSLTQGVRDNLRTMLGVLTRIMIYMHGEFTHAMGKRQLTHNVRCTSHELWYTHARVIHTHRGLQTAFHTIQIGSSFVYQI